MRKPPTYSPREQAALEHAHCIVAKVVINGEWREQKFFCQEGESSARDILVRVQHALRFHRSFEQIVLYAEAVKDGQVMRANVPHDYVPHQLR